MGKLEEMLSKYFKDQGMKFVELNVLTANVFGKIIIIIHSGSNCESDYKNAVIFVLSL